MAAVDGELEAAAPLAQARALDRLDRLGDDLLERRVA